MTKMQRAWPIGYALLITFGLLAGCGGRQSAASKSAAAYQEAVRKGTPVTGGHEHGGHSAEPGATAPEEHAGMPGMGHESMPGMTARQNGGEMSASMPGMKHSTTQRGSMPAMDHSKENSGSMPGMDHSQMNGKSMPGMDHSKMRSGSMAGMGHAQANSGSMPAMDHSKMNSGSMAGMEHPKVNGSSMSGMNHSQMQRDSMTGMNHSTTNGGVQNGAATLSGATPAQTLTVDPFDAPAKTSLTEAAKTSGAPAPGGHDMGEMTPDATHGSPPTAPSRDTATSEVVYTCPMHPEVTSAVPGKCPQCGMTLVRKK